MKKAFYDPDVLHQAHAYEVCLLSRQKYEVFVWVLSPKFILPTLYGIRIEYRRQRQETMSFYEYQWEDMAAVISTNLGHIIYDEPNNTKKLEEKINKLHTAVRKSFISSMEKLDNYIAGLVG